MVPVVAFLKKILTWLWKKREKGEKIKKITACKTNIRISPVNAASMES